ncbi:hypothetical protein [Anaerotignum sp.]
MRKRKWQTLLYIFLIFVLSCFYIHAHQLYFSPEDVFYACERGLRSGPSEEIALKYEQEDGGVMVVGRQETGIFAVPVEKTHFFLWRMKGGGIDGEYFCGNEVDGYLNHDGKVLGLSRNPEITEVSFIVGNRPDRNWQEFVCIPDENGFIHYDTEFDGWEDYVLYWEGRNAAGEVIYADEDDGLVKSLRSGNFTPEAKKVTKPYPVAPNVN